MDSCTCGSIPDGGGVSAAAGNQMAAVGRKGEAMNVPFVTFEQPNLCSAGKIVEADDGALVWRHRAHRCRQQPAIRRHRYSADFAEISRPGFTADDAQRLARRQIPDPDRLVL